MKRLVRINDREIPINGDRVDALLEVEPGVYSVLSNGKSLDVRIAPQSAGYILDVLGHRFQAEVRDPRNVARRSQAGLAGGVQNVSASMPGKVVRVLVAEGQEIEAGQGLIVVEAMKMQNEMRAAKSGRVAKVNSKPGDTVAAGEVLVRI